MPRVEVGCINVEKSTSLRNKILAVRGQGQNATDQALPVSVVEGIVGDIATKTGGWEGGRVA